MPLFSSQKPDLEPTAAKAYLPVHNRRSIWCALRWWSETIPFAPRARALFEHWDDPELLQKVLEIAKEIPGTENDIASHAYALSKYFVQCFAKANVVRFGKKGCRIISVSPGCYLTPMHQYLIDHQPETATYLLNETPLGRWGKPYEIGKLVAFLCSSGAGFITGVDILADGGFELRNTVKQIQ